MIIIITATYLINEMLKFDEFLKQRLTKASLIVNSKLMVLTTPIE